MGENTKIEWADHTLNWWTGCEHVSPACDGCYAEAWAKRAGRDFAVRKITSDQIHRLPLKWQRDEAWREKHGRKPRVFVNSLADFFDNKVPQAWRESFYVIARSTPDVIYMLLTKRIGNAVRMLPADWDSGYKNIWIGSTVVTQEEAERDIPKLLCTPARTRFLSCEPLLGPIDLRSLQYDGGDRLPEEMRVNDGRCSVDALQGLSFWPGSHYISPAIKRNAKFLDGELYQSDGERRRIDLVIAGGESGGRARPSHPNWFRSLRDQCIATGAAFHLKQWGEWGPEILPPVRDSYRWPIERGEPDGGVWSYRVGKKVSGRLLDGRTWDQFPQREQE